MSTHHKGDIAVAATISYLVEQDCHVAVPLHAHLHYDLIVEYLGRCKRLQVKHGVANSDKAVASLRTVYARKEGNVVRRREDDDYDLLAVYHPVLKQVRVVPVKYLGVSSVTVDFSMEPASLTDLFGE